MVVIEMVVIEMVVIGMIVCDMLSEISLHVNIKSFLRNTLII